MTSKDLTALFKLATKKKGIQANHRNFTSQGSWMPDVALKPEQKNEPQS